MDTQQRIVRAMLTSRFPTLGASEIAHAAGLAESTVRRHLPVLMSRHVVRETAWRGVWTTNQQEARVFVGADPAATA
jgi:predicted ArsR family transcriptional regulator